MATSFCHAVLALTLIDFMIDNSRRCIPEWVQLPGVGMVGHLIKYFTLCLAFIELGVPSPSQGSLRNEPPIFPARICPDWDVSMQLQATKRYRVYWARRLLATAHRCVCVRLQPPKARCDPPAS